MPEVALVLDALRIGRDQPATRHAHARVEAVVALEARRVAALYHVPLTAQVDVAVEAAEVVAVPVLVFGIGVGAGEDQLYTNNGGNEHTNRETRKQTDEQQDNQWNMHTDGHKYLTARKASTRTNEETTNR